MSLAETIFMMLLLEIIVINTYVVRWNINLSKVCECECECECVCVCVCVRQGWKLTPAICGWICLVAGELCYFNRQCVGYRSGVIQVRAPFPDNDGSKLVRSF